MSEKDSRGNASTPSSRNPPWTRDELILALDLYFRLYPHGENSRHPSVDTLSKLLHDLAIHAGQPTPGRFRSRDSVHMKLNNFRGLDPSTGETGLSHGGRRDKEVWDEFVDDRQRLGEIADGIRAYIASPPTMEAAPAEDDGDDGYAASEGAVLLRQHKSRERSPSLVRRKKEHVLRRSGVLACEVCDFVYSSLYGELGDGFIECHHTLPVSQLRPGQHTRLRDLALVCANCHRMLHRGRQVLTITVLRDIMRATVPPHVYGEATTRTV